jgi:hypothetical protein
MQPQTMNAMKTDRKQLRLAFFLTPWRLFPNFGQTGSYPQRRPDFPPLYSYPREQARRAGRTQAEIGS